MLDLTFRQSGDRSHDELEWDFFHLLGRMAKICMTDTSHGIRWNWNYIVILNSAFYNVFYEE